MREIDEELIRRIADYLIDWIGRNREERKTITYDILGRPFNLRANSDVLSDILGILSRTCNDCVMSNGQRLPLISSIVVRGDTDMVTSLWQHQ